MVWMGGDLPGSGWKWKWAMGLLNFGVIGMTVALPPLRAVLHRTMHWRMLFGLMTFAGAGLLAWNLLTIGVGKL